MRRNVVLLAACQALLYTSSSLVVATAALVGVALAPSIELSTLPLGLMFLATMSATMPASLLMKRFGRRAGFLLGGAIGALGSALCAAGIQRGSFLTFCIGLALIGVFNGVGQYYRFTAAEVASEQYRSRAISLVMAGGLIAAFTGPNLARLTRDMMTPAAFTASYLSLVAVSLLGMVLISGLRVPPLSAVEIDGPTRPLARIARQPVFAVALLGAMVSYGVMNLLMTATPLAMNGGGFTFGDTAWVIQWHVLGMFAPSFFTGHLIRRFGVANVMLAGGVLLLACVVVNLSGISATHFWAALVLLGVGWNFLFIGATTLLTESYEPAEKAKVQGLNDLLVFAIVAATASTSGALHHGIGWTAMNVGVVPFVVLSIASVVWLRAHPARRPVRV